MQQLVKEANGKLQLGVIIASREDNNSSSNLDDSNEYDAPILASLVCNEDELQPSDKPFGLTIFNIGTGNFITEVEPRSIAALSGLQAGFKIVSINGHAVTSDQKAKATMHQLASVQHSDVKAVRDEEGYLDVQLELTKKDDTHLQRRYYKVELVSI